MIFLLSARCWQITLQTWQAEYLVIALYVVFALFPRPQNSPETKPVEAINETNYERISERLLLRNFYEKSEWVTTCNNFPDVILTNPSIFAH
jgi:endogenous inhibitor of DNA gyrase (YacG/DUF329 family)